MSDKSKTAVGSEIAKASQNTPDQQEQLSTQDKESMADETEIQQADDMPASEDAAAQTQEDEDAPSEDGEEGYSEDDADAEEMPKPHGKKVLLAFGSQTIKQILSSYLDEAGFETICASDGIEAFKMLFSEAPDCLVLSSELPLVTGDNLCRILKNTPQIKSTPVILCSSSQNDDVKFATETSGADGFYVPSSENLHTLYSMITSCLQKFRMAKKSKPRQITDTEIIQLCSEASGEQFFDLYAVRDALKASSYIWDTEQLLRHIAGVLSSVSHYDALGIILNEANIIEFYDYSDMIHESDFDDFRKICQSDFESRITSRKDFNWKKSVLYESIIDQFEDGKRKLKSYDLFPIDASLKFPITVHVASASLSSMNVTTKNRVDYITHIYGPIIEKNNALRKSMDAEKKMRTAFERFLPSKVIDRIVAGETFEMEAIGEQRKIAVLISDIRDFTEISEKNDPKKIIEFLNRYFVRMGEIIKKHGGIIDKFEGDSIMALFGIPESHKYNGYRAVNAALEMEKEIDKVDTEDLYIPKGKFRAGIGVHYGQPLSGIFGSEEKKEYTVIGDDVNLASRIEGLTKIYGSPILITNAVKEDIEAAEADSQGSKYINEKMDYSLRYLDNVKVKGKSIPVELYEITGVLDKYSANFTENYTRGLCQYLAGNFSGAKDYLRIAKILKPDDLASQVLLERCERFVKERPENWDGAIALTSK